MTFPDSDTPFHTGELEAQSRAGAGDVAQWAKGFIRDHLSEQHRIFHANLPFLIVAGADERGKTWVTVLEGQEKFVRSPDPYHLIVKPTLDKDDPLAKSFASGTNIGVLGIELATRRRNRFSGFMRHDNEQYCIDILQAFGNCPQHIHPRNWTRVERSTIPVALTTTSLSTTQISQIQNADTLFIGSGHSGSNEAQLNGYDASHRGGESGFVKVLDSKTLKIPDYAGNNFFNTVGNLMTDSRVGLLFIDFESGGLLHITGRASIDWEPENPHDSGAMRIIHIDIENVIERLQAVSLRWTKQQDQSLNLKLVRREDESRDITSFYFISADDRSLKPFEAGQHLPIEVQIPGQSDISRRTYSLSGTPEDLTHYRISVKREKHGTVSRYFHDDFRPGMQINALQPSGGFVIPCKDCPLVFVSAGVGLTPMLSMMHSIAVETRLGWFIHGTRNGSSHALREEVNQLVNQNSNLQKRIYYSRPEQDDVLGRDYDIKGRITAKDLIELDAGNRANYMLCGPMSFLADLRNDLEKACVSADQIHFETFGVGN